MVLGWQLVSHVETHAALLSAQYFSHVPYCPQVCRAFAATGSCVYGTRCRFIHGHAFAPNNLADPAASALLAATLLSHTTGNAVAGDLTGGMEGVHSLDDPGLSRMGARRVSVCVRVSVPASPCDQIWLAWSWAAAGQPKSRCCDVSGRFL